MDKLITATKKIDCDYATVNSARTKVYIQVYNIALPQLAAIFSDPAETMQLRFGNLYVEGYTRLLSIMPGENTARVALGKE